MRDRIIAILRGCIYARFGGESYDTDWVGGIETAVDEIMALLVLSGDEALAAAKIIRNVAASREGLGYYPLAEALEGYAEMRQEDGHAGDGKASVGATS